MRFLIITHVLHKKSGVNYAGYAPYIQEMNLWLKHMNAVEIVAPLIEREGLSPIDIPYKHDDLSINKIPQIEFTSIQKVIISFFKLPIILLTIFKACKKADHIHLRCPGNIGLLGCLVQILFPSKLKTAKYAGNWDPKSKQPLSYKVQKWILNNTFLTRRMTVLVYGKWNNHTHNIKSFFTASYLESEKESINIKSLKGTLNLLFVGTLSDGKQPLLTVKAINELIKLDYNVHLDIYGEGPQRRKIEDYISKNNLSKHITLHGNKDKATLKNAYRKAHFLVIMSKSEGWPKVIAEAMFWKCLPVSTAVSCVPEMLEMGSRGSLVQDNVHAIIKEIESYIKDEALYASKIENAFNWSRQYTLNRFDNEIKDLLKK